MARKNNTRDIRKPTKTIAIGAGKTELFYLQHLKNNFQIEIELRPRFYGNDNAFSMNKRVEEALEMASKVICLYDKDVTQWNDAEKQRLMNFENKYGNDREVVLCPSMPSIEYWFLLHFETNNGSFFTSDAVIKQLKKYIPDYAKHEDFLKNDGWFKLMIAENKLNDAIERAEKPGSQNGHPFTHVHKLFK